MIDDNTAHELAARLHNVNGKISRAKRDNRIDDGAYAGLNDAQSLLKEVIADLLCSESVESRMSRHRMPVIPRDDNPPTDPNLTREATS